MAISRHSIILGIVIIMERVLEQRPQGEYKDEGDDDGYAHVPRGVHAQVHAGEGDEQGQKDADDLDPRFLAADGQGTPAPHGGLGVSAGEGVACGGFPGGLYDGEVGIQHPGAGDAAGDLEELIDVDPEKARHEQEIALLFVNAPEQDHARGDEEHFVAEFGEKEHEGVQDGVADGFEPV